MKYRRNVDDDIRALERAWEATNSSEDLERLNVARLRAGMLKYHALKPAWSGVVNAPPEATAAWGARALIENGRVSILPDRHETAGISHELQEELRGALNAGPLRDALAEARRLLRRHVIDSREAKEVVLFDNASIRILGNTNASGGYIYMNAFLKPPGWDVIEKACEKCQESDSDLGECSVCSILLCSGCRDTCEHCEQYICEGFHQNQCRNCTESICTSDECSRQRKPRSCDNCGELFCYDCRAEAKNCPCAEDDDNFCDKCDDELAQCADCGNTFCSCDPCPCRQEEDEESEEAEDSEFRRYNPEEDEDDLDDFAFDDDDDDDDDELGGWAVIHESGDLIADGFGSKVEALEWLEQQATDGLLEDAVDTYDVTEVEP